MRGVSTRHHGFYSFYTEIATDSVSSDVPDRGGTPPIFAKSMRRLGTLYQSPSMRRLGTLYQSLSIRRLGTLYQNLSESIYAPPRDALSVSIYAPPICIIAKFGQSHLLCVLGAHT